MSLLIIVFVISLSNAFASVGFDSTFGNNGRVLSNPAGLEDVEGRSMALQSDGKIIMLGEARLTLGMVVVRYNSNGSLDTTFGNNGWTSVTFGGNQTYANSVAVQSDGKIVVGGATYTTAGNVYTSDFAIARLNSDGSLDTTFDGDGKATVSFNPEVIASVNEGLISLKIASDGKIVVAGYLTSFPQIGRFGIARLNADGSLDTTFGTNGRVFDNLDYYKLMYDMALLPDGSIAVGGGWVNALGNGRIVQKYNVNGGLEWTYSIFDGPVSSPSINSITAQPDGKLVMVGYRISNGVAFRLNSDGTLDNSFSNAPIPGGSIFSSAIQPDGKIIGNYYADGYSTFSLVRYNTNGVLDNTFGSGGLLKIPKVANQDSGNTVLIQPDGKILVGGYVVFTNPVRRYFTLMRFQETAVARKPQFDYDGDGKSDVSVYRPSNGGWYILRSSDNGFVANQWGVSTDIPQSGDYDGDGRADIAVFRPSNGIWYIQRSLGGSLFVQFGSNGDKPIAGDYDGDGKTDFAVWRSAPREWFILKSSNNQADIKVCGSPNDSPVPADYDGDGKVDLAVFRPSNGVWYQMLSTQGSASQPFGLSGDFPTPGAYTP